ncbi:MAG: restriction endonuclease subunit S, partial [Marinomonas sp.]
MQPPQYPRYETYKDSGISWAYDTPVHWDVKPITAVAEVVSEASRPDLELLSVYLGRGVIRFSDASEKRTNATSVDLSKYQVVRPGNLVLNNQQAWRGSVGVSAYEGIISPAYIILELKDNFDAHFANYYFQTPTTVAHFLVSSKGVGTIQRNLYWPALKRCSVTVPPLPEQQAIAQFLDDKTAKIDQAVKIKEDQIALLKERKQIIIQEAVTKGLNPDAPMKDSGIDWIGQIPAHWDIKRLKFITEIVKRIIGFEGPDVLSITQKG